MDTQKRNREWVKRSANVVKAINAETKKPRPVKSRNTEPPFCPEANVRYLYQPEEHEGGCRNVQLIQYGQ